jgi:hypothetical protein
MVMEGGRVMPLCSKRIGAYHEIRKEHNHPPFSKELIWEQECTWAQISIFNGWIRSWYFVISSTLDIA